VLAAFVRFLIRLCPWLNYAYRHRIRPKQLCPACGDRGPHEVKFNPKADPTPLVVLTCRICSARWGYNPIVKAQKFVKPATEE
jgi:hypothetical protein